MLRARSILLCALITLAPRTALAADVEEEAAAAYDRGASAYDRGDFTTAATELARADELAPNDVTLELALSAVARTDEAVLGMTLVDRAAQRPKAGARLTATAEAARKRFAAKVGSIKVDCSNGPPCEVRIDDRPVPPDRAVIVVAGKHRIVMRRGGSSREESRDIVVDGGKSVELLASTFPDPDTAMDGRLLDREAPSRGLSPVWFWVGAGVTVALGGATALSALDTASTYDDFAADRSNVDLSDDGRSAERRTIVLGVVTGALAISTAVLGLALVDWKKSRTAIAPGAVRVRF